MYPFIIIGGEVLVSGMRPSGRRLWVGLIGWGPGSSTVVCLPHKKTAPVRGGAALREARLSLSRSIELQVKINF